MLREKSKSPLCAETSEERTVIKRLGTSAAMDRKDRAGAKGRLRSVDQLLIRAAGGAASAYCRATGRPPEQLAKICYAAAGASGVAGMALAPQTVTMGVAGVAYAGMRIRHFDESAEEMLRDAWRERLDRMPSGAKVLRLGFAALGLQSIGMAASLAHAWYEGDAAQMRTYAGCTFSYGSVLLMGAADYLLASHASGAGEDGQQHASPAARSSRLSFPRSARRLCAQREQMRARLYEGPKEL